MRFTHHTVIFLSCANAGAAAYSSPMSASESAPKPLDFTLFSLCPAGFFNRLGNSVTHCHGPIQMPRGTSCVGGGGRWDECEPNERLREAETLSFRGDAKHRTRNLEIPRCAIAHLRSGANAPSRNDGLCEAIHCSAKQVWIATSLPPPLVVPALRGKSLVPILLRCVDPARKTRRLRRLPSTCSASLRPSCVLCWPQ